MTTAQRKRLKIGDLVEISTSKGLAYVQYILKEPGYGSLIRVLPGIYKSQPPDLSILVSQPERFLVFFPLGTAVARSIVTIVSNESIPERSKQFPLMRIPGAIDTSGHVQNWWLWNGTKKWIVNELTSEQQNLSIAEVWNDTILIERIENGWSPSDNV